MFKKEGIEANSEDDLIKKLDIRQTTFRELFSDKKDVVKKTVLFDMEEQKREHAVILSKASSPVEEIFLLLHHGINDMKKLNPLYITDLQSHYPEVWQLGMEHLNTYSYHQLSEIINRGVINGDFRKDVNIQLVTKIILEQLNMMLNPVMFPPSRYDLAEVFRSIYLYYMRGICTEKGGKTAEEFFTRPVLSPS